MRKEIFFAYQSKGKSKSPDNVDAIIAAKDEITRKTKYRGITWQDLQNNGRILVKSIFAAINKCDVFACDLTYLNHNVLFELGYAISRNKRLLILVNDKVGHSTENISNIDILKTVGYSVFCNSNHIVNALEKVPSHAQLLSDLSIQNKGHQITNDIFFIRNSSGSQADLDANKYLTSLPHRVIFDDSSEVEYRPFTNYIENIACSSATIVHINSSHLSMSFEDNAKAALLAGIACGMEKKVLLLAPAPYNPPIDYADIMIEYPSAPECVSKLANWIAKNVQIIQNNAIAEDSSMDLLKLGLGYDIAENEKEQLTHYFVETDAYLYAEKHNRVFFIGRKGTGKTAIYIMLCRKYREDKNTYVIDLKPESSELLNNIEVARLYNSAAQKQSFFYTIWKFVIYGKLAIEASRRFDQKFLDENSVEYRIKRFVTNNEYLLTQHYLETINYIAQSSDANPLEKTYIDIINPMVLLLKEYFSKKRYHKFVIIADNLDKTWDASTGLDIQTSMLLNLFEVTGVIEKELAIGRHIDVKSKVILFLRKDIFEYILRKAREPDKLILNRREIDWSEHPVQLKQVIEKRFSYVLGIEQDTNLSQVWMKYFDLRTSVGSNTFEKILDACIPRPRDLLMFITHMFESAVNNDHSKVNETDFEQAHKEYSSFLYQNLIAEMVSEYPAIRILLDRLHNRYTEKVEFLSLRDDITDTLSDNNPDTVCMLIDELIDNGYFRLINETTGAVYTNYHEADLAYVQTYKKILWFTYKPKKTTIYAVLTPQYSKKLKKAEQ